MELFSTSPLSFLVVPFLAHPHLLVEAASHALALDDHPLWMVDEQAVSVPLHPGADRLLGEDMLGRVQWTDMIAIAHGLYHGPDLVPLGAAALTRRRHPRGLLHPGETRYEETVPDAADAVVPVTAATVATAVGAEVQAETEAAVDTALAEDKSASRRSRRSVLLWVASTTSSCIICPWECGMDTVSFYFSFVNYVVSANVLFEDVSRSQLACLQGPS